MQFVYVAELDLIARGRGMLYADVYQAVAGLKKGEAVVLSPTDYGYAKRDLARFLRNLRQGVYKNAPKPVTVAGTSDGFAAIFLRESK